MGTLMVVPKALLTGIDKDWHDGRSAATELTSW